MPLRRSMRCRVVSFEDPAAIQEMTVHGAAYNRRMRFPDPPPDADALAASARLTERLFAGLDAEGGWTSFQDYMGRVLYEPGLGYYTGGARKFGAAGDFVTAPEISPLFGGCVGAQIAGWLAHLPRRVTEFGAGSGALAAQLLRELDTRGLGDCGYDIVELSGELRARQRETLARLTPAALTRVRWLDRLPPSIDGVVIGNEVLDAMPARVFRVHHGRVSECGVGHALHSPEGSSSGSGGAFDAPGQAASPALDWRERPADPAFAARVADALAAAGWGRDPAHWPPDYRSELGEQAIAWVGEIAGRITRGVLLLFDYGFPAAEFYHPQRAMGTMMCHYRHRAHGDPFLLPGLQDITVHVDFTAIARVAAASGTHRLGYTSQANFLLNCGLLDRLPGADGNARAHARTLREVLTLVSEAEMGELFKAIAFARAPDQATLERLRDASVGFVRGDRGFSLEAAARGGTGVAREMSRSSGEARC